MGVANLCALANGSMVHTDRQIIEIIMSKHCWFGAQPAKPVNDPGNSHLMLFSRQRFTAPDGSQRTFTGQ
jgi:hypothetical protein